MPTTSNTGRKSSPTPHQIKQRLFVIPEPVLQEVLNYLGRRPWAEVDPLVVGLRSNMVELVPGSTHEDITKELERIRARRSSKTAP